MGSFHFLAGNDKYGLGSCNAVNTAFAWTVSRNGEETVTTFLKKKCYAVVRNVEFIPILLFQVT